MGTFFNNWRYYKLGRDDYKECMEMIFHKNIFDLFKMNTLVAALSAFFAIISIVIENNFAKAGLYIATTAVALFLVIFSAYKHKQDKAGKKIHNGLIYTLFAFYYANVMTLGLYLAVWAEPDKVAGSFLAFLICVLFAFTISPVLYFSLTLGVTALYIIFVIAIKDKEVWNYDIQNAVFAAIISIIFGWNFIRYRMTTALSISKLEVENTVDALTKLKNRRDYMNTFQRFLTHHRPSDKFLCIALLDIDCFKNYNDHYGHPQGDECLRIIGKALNELNKNKGIYAARVGGEEFSLLWHIENSNDATEAGEYINQLVRDLNIPHEKSKVAPYVTVSVGIHVAQCGITNDTKELYNLADKALYAAKGNGRNCSVISI